MVEEKLYREKNWWEYYPLHKVWCNDWLPLIPRFWYRKGDECNASNFGFHWLFIHFWTLSFPQISIEAEIACDRIGVGLILPYMRFYFGLRGYSTWVCNVYYFFSRDPKRNYEDDNEIGI